MKEVLVSFPLTGRKGKDVKKKGESNLLDICSMIAFSSDNGRDDYLKSIRQNASGIVVKDRKENHYELSTIWYRPWRLDGVSFIAANVIEENEYVKNCVHVLCEYYDSGKIYKCCVVVPQEEYYEKIKDFHNDTDHEKYIVGTCIRKNYMVPGKSKYNKRSHSVRQTESIQKQRTKMLNFCLIEREKQQEEN